KWHAGRAGGEAGAGEPRHHDLRPGQADEHQAELPLPRAAAAAAGRQGAQARQGVASGLAAGYTSSRSRTASRSWRSSSTDAAMRWREKSSISSPSTTGYSTPAHAQGYPDIRPS